MKKERLIKNGNLVLLDLAPVDPRSLMQGDYMDLRYAITDNIQEDEIPKRGFCVLKKNDKEAVVRVRFQKERLHRNEGEFLISFTSDGKWRINIGEESFFFQEGDAYKFEEAAYGGLVIDDNGNSLLIGLYDENKVKIE